MKMRKTSKGSRILSMLLVLAMAMSFLPVSAFAAAVGTMVNVDTGLTGNIDTGDTISLPVKILDYEADGMLFEFAEATAGVAGIGTFKKNADGEYTDSYKTAKDDFGATWAEDYTTLTSVGGSINTGNYWSDVTLALKTGTYANYTRATWKGNTTSNWTGNRAGVLLADFTTSSTYTTDQIRYMVVVFRSNVRSGNFTVGLNRANLNGADTNGNYTGNIAVTTENNTNWTYAVLDLKTGTLGSNWSKGAVHGVYVGLPIDASGEWIDLAHVAFFSNADQARAFGEYALTDGSDRGDNRAFGLLRGSRNQAGTIDYTGIDDAIADSVQQLNTYGSTATEKDYSALNGLGYKLLGTFGLRGIANIGLLQSGLKNGYPVYKQEVVDYLAGLLEKSLKVTERTSDGWKNYRFIKGTPSPVYGNVDLATALRTRINGNKGSYAEAAGKKLVGTWAECQGNIKSYYDAAFFLLNSIFVPGSYNELKRDYDYLVLSAGTDKETGDKVYVFDAGYTTSATPTSAAMAIGYDTNKHTIQNTSAAGKTHFYYESGATTTLYPFVPITDRNTADGMTKSPYYQDDGVINGVKKKQTMDTLYKHNFSFAMVSEGEFTYYADDELFFEFEGDDDVYLFINDELVLDIGSAHSLDTVRFNLNEYVNAAKAGTLGSDTRNKKLALEDGVSYSFKFYYMERHSYGSNMRISTNIRVTDPNMLTQKTAWQDGTQLDFGSVVDKDKIVEYGFGITNNGQENLYNLTFTDNNIGVKLDPTNGLTVTGSRVTDLNGGELTASDLTAVITHPNYDDIHITFANNTALKNFLDELSAQGTEAGAGLYVNATVLIRGIGYKLSDAQSKEGQFDNIVLTTATNSTGSKTLQGQASMRVFVPADPMYYQWANHNLKISKSKLIGDIIGAVADKNNPLYDANCKLTVENVNKIELVTKAGTAISSPNVSVDGSYNVTASYTTPGSKVFYVKVTYNGSKNHIIVPVLIIVTDVKDSVYVLDYGLDVNLTDNNELFKNDAVTAPGRDSSHSILAIGSNGAYANNEITFTKDADGVIAGQYGTYKMDGQTLTYMPDKFLEGMDMVQVAVNVYENDTTPSKIDGALNINNEVEMYKNIMVIPANVVYYEDCFPAITYTTPNEIVDLNKTQSNDQDENYGHDDTYAGEGNDENSAGRLTTIAITSRNMVASFDFVGTGFELISRTNATDSASILIQVKDNSGALLKTYPVITQFDNENDGGDEEIYQVPVIRVKDLDISKAPFTVEITGVPSNNYDDAGNVTGTNTTYLYVDGLRIYQPYQDGNDYYQDTEKDAEFFELRDEIAAGKVALLESSDEFIQVSTETVTWTENLNNEFESNTVNSVDDYLLAGPNNEVYMSGEEISSALVFYVKETDAQAHNLQIAFRAIDPGIFHTGNKLDIPATAKVGYEADGKYAWQTIVEDYTSGTEQYFTIDYKNCFYDEEKDAYQIVIAVDAGMVCFSNLKMTGLELLDISGEADMGTLYYENGFLKDITTGETVNAACYVNFASLEEQLKSTKDASELIPEYVPVEPEVEEELPEDPAENREETIRSLIDFLKKTND